jgi:hypothetical protein
MLCNQDLFDITIYFAEESSTLSSRLCFASSRETDPIAAVVREENALTVCTRSAWTAATAILMTTARMAGAATLKTTTTVGGEMPGQRSQQEQVVAGHLAQCLDLDSRTLPLDFLV